MNILSKSIYPIVLLCFLSGIVMASDASVFSVQSSDKNSISLQLTNVNQPEIQITLKDTYGIILHNETVNKEAVNYRKYNLENLPAGIYSLIVSYDDMIKIQTINKRYKNIEIAKDKLQTIFKPTFSEHSKFVDLSIESLSNQKIYIKKSDSEGNVLYSEYDKINGLFEKRFNLSQLEKGYYTFTLGVKGKDLNKEFKKLVNWDPKVYSEQKEKITI